MQYCTRMAVARNLCVCVCVCGGGGGGGGGGKEEERLRRESLKGHAPPEICEI